MWWKVLGPIDFTAMASSDDAASIRVDSVVKEKRAEDLLAALIEKNQQLILIKYFEDLAKKNPLAKERKAPPCKESDDPVPLSAPTIIPDDAWSSTVGGWPHVRWLHDHWFHDYISE